MRDFTRRDVLKSALAVPTALGIPAAEATGQSGDTHGNPGQVALRERLLLDFGWRFHFGHANDPSSDFGFEVGRSGGFQKSGGFLAPSSLAYDDSEWEAVD